MDEDQSPLHRARFFGRRRRLPVVRQQETAECGLVCLAMLLGWHGHHANLAELRRRFPSSSRGCTLEDLTRWSDEVGFVNRPVRLDLDELDQLQTPSILHWDMDHFVVLANVKDGKVILHDPARGRVTLSVETVSKHFTGVALELTTGPDFRRKQPPPPVSLRKLAGSVVGLRSSMARLFGFAIALEVIALFMPQFLQILVDQVIADNDVSLLTLIGCGFLGLTIAQSIISAFRTWTVTWVSTHFSMNWTANVFRHLMRLPLLFFNRRNVGDVTSRFGAIGTIQQNLTTQLIGALMDGVMSLATLVLMAIYSPLLSGIVVIGAVVYSLSRVAWFHTYMEANLSQITTDARQQTSLIEAIRGASTIQLNNQAASHTSRFLRDTSDALETRVEIQRLNLLFSLAGGIISGTQRIAVLWVGASLALTGRFSAGMLMAFATYADQFTNRSAALVDYVIQFRLLRLQGERLADIVLTPTEPHLQGFHSGDLPMPSVQFDNVSFRYSDSDPWIITQASFEIKPGESVAISGPSGCGKSTLLHLILGLLEPQVGRILIGGVDLKQLGKTRYRSMLGSALQDDRLFSGTIADNIAFFSTEADFSRVQNAAEQADIHTDILALPMGYNSHIGDMGSTLSGGQRQRIILARALYRRPRILVLDEATSHLDVPRENHITALIKRMDITRILVSHRPETVASADRILELSNGRLRSLIKKPEATEPLAPA